MELAELMAKLSENYKIGIGVGTGIVVVVYILISIFAIRRVYKYKGYIALKGMIPVIHLFLFLVGVGSNKPKKEKQGSADSAESKKGEDTEDSKKPETKESTNTSGDIEDFSLDDLDIF